MSTKECPVCHKDISHLPGQSKFCSRTCYEDSYYGEARRLAKASIQEKPCLHCGTIFKPKTRKKTDYCTIDCIYKAKNARMKTEHLPRICEGCGQDFKPTRSFQVFCSYVCRNKVTYMKRVACIPAYQLRDMEAPMTIAQKMQLDADIAHREAIAREINEQELPLCTRCAIERVRDPEAPNMQCKDCVEITKAEEAVKEKCQHFFDDTKRCVVCGKVDVTV